VDALIGAQQRSRFSSLIRLAGPALVLLATAGPVRADALVEAAEAAVAGASAPATPGSPSDERRPEWVHVPASDLNMDFYMDRASIHVSDGEVEFWDVVIFHKPTQKDEASTRWIKEKRTLRRVNCARQEQALIRGASFDDGGHLIEAVTLPPATATRNAVHAGSVAASELYRACKEAGLDVPAEAAERARGPVSGLAEPDNGKAPSLNAMPR
jgi:hypothetical protein